MANIDVSSHPNVRNRKWFLGTSKSYLLTPVGMSQISNSFGKIVKTRYQTFKPRLIDKPHIIFELLPTSTVKAVLKMSSRMMVGDRHNGKVLAHV